MGNGGCLLSNLGAGEFLVEGEDWSLGRGVSVAGTTAARVEAGAAGRSGSLGDSGGWHSGGIGCLGSAEEVTSAATAGVGVAVLRHRGVWLSDGVARRHLDASSVKWVDVADVVEVWSCSSLGSLCFLCVRDDVQVVSS